MKLIATIAFAFLGFYANAQWKDYKLTQDGDTVNCIDKNDKKQGYWIIRKPAKYGNPASEEVGNFVDDLKEGTWKVFSQMGDPLAVENYKWGNKHGKCSYYNINGLIREEQWVAMNPAIAFDTVDVVDPVTEAVERVVVKNEGISIRHGWWVYHDPEKKRVLNQEEYVLGKLQETYLDGEEINIDTVAKKKEKEKPKVVEEYEKKYKNKKHKTRPGSTGL